MKRTPVRIGAPAELHFQQMTGIVGQPVHLRVIALQPAGKKINGQRKAVHLGKQRNKKRGKRAEAAPVAFGLGVKKLKAKKMNITELMNTSDHRP